MRTALVTGACGLLGQHLVRRLKSEYKVFAVDIAPNIFEENSRLTYRLCDMTDSDATRQLFSETSPDVIYNCAAFNDVDGCERERDKAHSVNVILVENLVGAEAGRIVHYSTDYVFNGRNGPYGEDDETDPVGYYGESKLQSERLLLDSNENHLVVRTNVLFGNGINVRPNFITWLVDNLRGGKELRIVTDQYNNPIHADNLAKTSIEAEERELTGILHLAGDSYLSRYEIALKTAGHFNLDGKLILPAKTSELGQAARRPLKGGLKIDKAKKLLSTPLLDLERGLDFL